MNRKKLGSLLFFLCSVVVLALLGFFRFFPANAEGHTPSGPPQEDTYTYEDLSSYFTAYESGSFVLYSEKQHQYTVHNKQLSETGLSPFSTFKIVHALIGLETGVLQDENTTFTWLGYRYEIEAWNKDQTLTSAVNNSTIWYFQRVAAAVGPQRMQDYLDKVRYGNRDISGGLIDFWLNSSLRISPMEQVEMLKRLYRYDLPFSRKNIDIVKRILQQDEQQGSKLYGKTGGNGWYVGAVETADNTYYFATKIMTPGITNGSKAKAVALAILKDKGIFVPVQANITLFPEAA